MIKITTDHEVFFSFYTNKSKSKSIEHFGILVKCRIYLIYRNKQLAKVGANAARKMQFRKSYKYVCSANFDMHRHLKHILQSVKVNLDIQI